VWRADTYTVSLQLYAQVHAGGDMNARHHVHEQASHFEQGRPQKVRKIVRYAPDTLLRCQQLNVEVDMHCHIDKNTPSCQMRNERFAFNYIESLNIRRIRRILNIRRICKMQEIFTLLSSDQPSCVRERMFVYSAAEIYHGAGQFKLQTHQGFEHAEFQQLRSTMAHERFTLTH
jgi:hypothetical protein